MMEACGLPIAVLVQRAQRGDQEAWESLVAEFQDVGAGLALGWCGDWHAASDIAQDAFVLAFTHLAELTDPQAFPAWFSTLVRTAAHRHVRRRQPTGASVDVYGEDPGELVVATSEALRVHAAVEALPVHERCVVALHYLGGLSYPDVAAFLGITVAATKKRAFSARARLKELLPVTPETFAVARPSNTLRLTKSVALFLAIRQGDLRTVERLLVTDPNLVGATETWSWDEAMVTGLRFAEDGTPLVRAVQTGSHKMVNLILRAGAPATQRCACAGGESALWAAVLRDDTTIVNLLLDAGADSNAAAFGAVTPLLLAAQRGNHGLVDLLTARGADPTFTDERGRTAADWLEVGESRVSLHAGGLLVTGIKAVDLFAPAHRGDLQYWPPALEVGAIATLYEMIRSVRPERLWHVGFEIGPYGAASAAESLSHLKMEGELRFTPGNLSVGDRRTHFRAALEEIAADHRDKVVVMQTAPGFTHDVALALAGLATDPNLLFAAVIEPAIHPNAPQQQPPEGYDAQIAFTVHRARRGLWPAIDPLTTVARSYPSERHERLATAARQVLAAYRHVDPLLEMAAPQTYSPSANATVAQALHRYLAQPFKGWEYATGQPGESTGYTETLDSVESLLGAT